MECRMYKISVDDGYGNVKVLVQDDQGAIQSHVVPTHFQLGAHGGLMNAQDGSFDTMVMKTGGQTFTVGDATQHGTTEFDDFPYHPANRAIVRYAIAQAGIPDDAEYELAVGLPIGQFYLGSGKNQTLIDRKVAHHREPISYLTDQDTPLSGPKVVRCFPQSVMAALTLAPADADVENMAVVDIGHRTTDVTVLNEGRLAFQRCGGLMDLGVSAAQRVFRAQIEGRFQRNFEASYEKAFRTRKVRISGQVFEVPEEFDAAVRQTGEQIRQAVEQIVRPIQDIDSVLLIGGGAYVFFDVLHEYWPQASRAEDPVFANARSWLEML